VPETAAETKPAAAEPAKTAPAKAQKAPKPKADKVKPPAPGSDASPVAEDKAIVTVVDDTPASV
jgi:hypothetical protein